jgi:tetratricopeptide (TPR) repeat protein
VELPASDPVRARIAAAWDQPGERLAERAESALAAARAVGMRQLEAPARGVLLQTSLGSPRERAEAAVLLAPDLPAAQAALASARRAEADPTGAALAFLSGLAAIPRHLEASLWVEAVAGQWAAAALILGSGLFLLVAAGAAVPSVARNLQTMRPDLPGPSVLAGIATLVLLPAALGEGAFGLVVGLGFMAAFSASWWVRGLVVAALATVLLGLYPMLDRAGASLAAIAVRPAALAAHTAENGLPSAVELARLEAAPDTRHAMRASAARARRIGDLETAEARYAPLVAGRGQTRPAADLLNNAANVRFVSGDAEGAIALYELAIETTNSPAIWFNLSQAYGRAVRLDDQDTALAQAQRLDVGSVWELTTRFTDGVADVPLSVRASMPDLLDAEAGAELGRDLRTPLAPGTGGRGVPLAAAWALGAACLGLGLGTLLQRTAGRDADHYDGIARALQSGSGDSSARARRVTELRRRQQRDAGLRGLLAWVVPGAAGVLRGRPLLGWLAALSVGVVAACLLRPGIALADPLSVGGMAEGLAWLGVAAGGLFYLLFLVLAMWLGEDA